MNTPTNENASRLSLAPVRLSYIAALRGVVPCKATPSFAYGQIGCPKPTAFLCMAASNPEGHFFAVVDGKQATECQKLAQQREVSNASFVTDASVLRDLDYLVYDTLEMETPSLSRDAFAICAEKTVRAGGLAAYAYRAYPNADETLRFVVNEFAPEMDAMQAKVFIQEVKDLGELYFKEHPFSAASLDTALKQGMPDRFFATCDDGGPAKSGTFDTMVSMVSHGFSYVGDSDISRNYMELMTPPSAHKILIDARTNLLYETLKDFATQKLDRCDVWCRTPVEQTTNMVALYGDMTFGITMPVEQIPTEMKTTGGKVVDLRLAPFPAMIKLMATMPISVGDFLGHEAGKMIAPADAVGAIQILVALSVASPMRSSYMGQKKAVTAQPEWATGFNSYLNDNPVTEAEVLMASPVVGGAVRVPARDALVMQAINRVGMQDSVSALLPELLRVSRDPKLAHQIMDVAEPTAETAYNMILDVVNRSMIQWYAYGLLAA